MIRKVLYCIVLYLAAMLLVGFGAWLFKPTAPEAKDKNAAQVESDSSSFEVEELPVINLIENKEQEVMKAADAASSNPFGFEVNFLTK